MHSLLSGEEQGASRT